MVPSRQKWEQLNHFAQDSIISKEDDALFLLPFMSLTDSNSTPDERLSWINTQILNIIRTINKSCSTTDTITVLVHASDIGMQPGSLTNLPYELQGKVDKYILFRRDTTVAYKHLTTPEKIKSDAYLTDLEILLCPEKY